MKQKGRILALDYGTKKVGAALSDPLQITASPYKTIRYSTPEQLFREIVQLIKEKEVQEIVVGLPVPLSGGRSQITQQVESFIDDLSSQITIPITIYNEQHTSADARQTLIKMGIKTGHNKDKVDAMAAAHLLRYYLDEQD